MAEPLSLARLPRTLTKDITPGSALELAAVGIQMMPKTDPVLSYLAVSDEREYNKMFNTSTAISQAVEQRRHGLLAEGSEVVPGSSGSARAKQLQEFAIAALKKIPAFPIIQQEMLLSIFWGWRPFEVQWGELRWKGASYFAPIKIGAHDPWQFEFTTDGFLARRRWTDFEVFRSVEQQLRWIVCTANSTRSPYGEAWFRRLWLLYFLAKQFEQMSAQAMQRALGILKASRTASGANPLRGSAAATDLPNELATVLRVLTSNNVLIEQAGWSLSVESQAEAAKTTREMLDFLDTRLRMAIVGQNLSGQVKEGSFAAAQAQMTVLEDLVKSDGRQLAEWINDGILRRVIVLNFGEVDEEDLPRWQPKVFAKVDREDVRLAHELRIPLDGKRLADALKVPALWEPGPDDELIQKPEMTEAMIPPGEPTAPKPRAPVGGKQPGQRTSDTAVADGFEHGTDELARHYGGLTRRFLDANPNPKA